MSVLFAGLIKAYGVLLYTFVGVVVLWRRPGHGIGRLALTIGLTFVVGILLSTLDLPRQLAGFVANLSDGFTLVALVVGGSLIVVRFPDGDRTSRLGALVELTLVLSVVGLMVTGVRDDLLRAFADSAVGRPLFEIASVVGITGVILAYLVAFADLGLRYRRADDLRQTQMRWVLAAEGLVVLAIILFTVFGSTYEWLFVLIFPSMGLPVLAVGVAITRYHLYDIDRIVSRSISYLVVTAVLVTIFASLTLIMQTLISLAVAAPGTSLDPRVVALSTLVVAALFNPLRGRVQSVVDRRFHRERYDAARIVAGFSGRLRDQLDLTTVSGELRATTTRALEPSTTGVWLRARAARP